MQSPMSFGREEYIKEQDYLCAYCHSKAKICDIKDRVHLCMFCFIYFVFIGRKIVELRQIYKEKTR